MFPNLKSIPVVTTPTATGTTVFSTALENFHSLKSGPGQLLSLAVTNTKASAQFILIIDSVALPGDGAVTLLYPAIDVATAAHRQITFAVPLVAVNGILVCNSSTGTFSKTIGAADCVFWARVI